VPNSRENHMRMKARWRVSSAKLCRGMGRELTSRPGVKPLQASSRGKIFAIDSIAIHAHCVYAKAIFCLKIKPVARGTSATGSTNPHASPCPK
jgi:hypothetical protein